MSFYNTCQVENCLYASEHVTERHCCGTCKLNGHGKLECSSDDKVKELEKFNGDFITKSCKIKGCLDPQTHTTLGHSCLYCDKRSNNHLKYCPLSNNIKMNETCENSICDNIEDFNKHLIDELQYQIKDLKLNISEYTSIYGGMGCSWFIRNNNGTIEYLFIHSDNWGQYSEESSHLPRYKAFIYNFRKANK